MVNLETTNIYKGTRYVHTLIQGSTQTMLQAFYSILKERKSWIFPTLFTKSS